MLPLPADKACSHDHGSSLAKGIFLEAKGLVQWQIHCDIVSILLRIDELFATFCIRRISLGYSAHRRLHILYFMCTVIIKFAVTFNKSQENRPLRQLKRNRLHTDQRARTQEGKMEMKKEGRKKRRKTKRHAEIYDGKQAIR
jgi:hypothetical protein